MDIRNKIRIENLIDASNEFEKAVKNLKPFSAKEAVAIKKFLTSLFNTHVVEKKED